LGEEFLRRAALPTPTNQLANELDRSSRDSATQSISQTAETTAASPSDEVSGDEVPIGIVEIPIDVCGSRRASPTGNQAARTEVFAEETSTVLVFPHGAVIRLSAAVVPGQMIMVANRKSAEVIPCRVVKVKNYPNVRGYAEIEFFRSTKGFWGAYATQGTLKRTLRSWPVTSERTVENFWSRNLSHEDSVLAKPASTSQVVPLIVRNKVESVRNWTIQKPSIQKLGQQAAKVVNIGEPEIELTAWDFPKKHALSSVATTNSSEFVPAHLESKDQFLRKASWFRGLSDSPRKKMIFACAVVVILLAIGATGIFLLHHNTEQPTETAEMNSQAEEPTGSSAANTIAGVHPESNPNSAVPAMPIANADNFPGNRNREYADNVRAFQTPVRAPSVERRLPSRKPLAAPVITHHSNTVTGREAPPDITGLNSNIKASANPAAIAAFLPSGGRMRGPRLILKSVPNYPAIAKRAAIEGEVTVDAVIDTNGKLTNMKVVSGQPLLQQAALDSLRTWKYEPAYLDDKPVPVQTSITVKFRIH
jgi:TonB family protein